MLEATSAAPSVGFAPVDYTALWSQPTSSSRRTPASTLADSKAPQTSAFSAVTDLFTSQTDEADLQVGLAIAKLKAAAAQVVRNQAAQSAAGGTYVRGGAQFTYAIGPDGQLYATGVSLSYDTSPVADDPQATIVKMQQVRAAALASLSPSAADFAAAATATRLEMQARLEMVQQMVEAYLPAHTQAESSAPGSLLDTFA